MRNLVLTGFMGTGKSTVAAILADRYGIVLADSDAEIERRAGCSIAEFWSRHDEPAFRNLEAEVFASILSRTTPQVVATGAGTLMSERNREQLHPDDLVITLSCHPEVLRARLSSERASRPLLAKLTEADVRSYIDRKLEERRAVYDLFVQVPAGDSTPEEVAIAVAELAGLDRFTLRFDATRTTDIVFGRGIASHLGQILVRYAANARILVVTDESTSRYPGVRETICSLVGPDGVEACITLPSGERFKNVDSVAEIYRACEKRGLDRSSMIVGVGGGVVGDMAGFAAATYMRGIHLALVPTTLLAQVDAAIGGKVGVDFDGVKNLVGAFHPAETVAVDPNLLKTLPEAAVSEGLAEIVKIAAVFSEALLSRVESLYRAEDVHRASDIIRSAAELKARVVEDDPYERGARALLNFGHTVGHAVEAGSGYRLSHGASISAGMIAETWLAEQLGLCDAEIRPRLVENLRRFNLPLSVTGIDPDAAWEAMTYDKKRLAGTLRFALPRSAGRGTVVEVSHDQARAALNYAMGAAS